MKARLWILGLLVLVLVGCTGYAGTTDRAEVVDIFTEPNFYGPDSGLIVYPNQSSVLEKTNDQPCEKLDKPTLPRNYLGQNQYMILSSVHGKYWIRITSTELLLKTRQVKPGDSVLVSILYACKNVENGKYDLRTATTYDIDRFYVGVPPEEKTGSFTNW